MPCPYELGVVYHVLHISYVLDAVSVSVTMAQEFSL